MVSIHGPLGYGPNTLTSAPLRCGLMSKKTPATGNWCGGLGCQAGPSRTFLFTPGVPLWQIREIRGPGGCAHLLSVSGHHTLYSAGSGSAVAERGFDPRTFGLWAQHANLCATPLWFNAEKDRSFGIGVVASSLRLDHHTRFSTPQALHCGGSARFGILEAGHTLCLCLDTTLCARPDKDLL